MKICRFCDNEVIGRSDKLFCSVSCKSKYHRKLRNLADTAAKQIDKILHRNRSILLEILGKKRLKIKVNRLLLEKKKFNYKYHTHFTRNSKGKIYYYVYDLAWMSFSDDDILIVRKI